MLNFLQLVNRHFSSGKKHLYRFFSQQSNCLSWFDCSNCFHHFLSRKFSQLIPSPRHFLLSNPNRDVRRNLLRGRVIGILQVSRDGNLFISLEINLLEAKLGQHRVTVTRIMVETLVQNFLKWGARMTFCK